MKIEEVKSTIMGTISIESVNFGQTVVDAWFTTRYFSLFPFAQHEHKYGSLLSVDVAFNCIKIIYVGFYVSNWLDFRRIKSDALMSFNDAAKH